MSVGADLDSAFSHHQQLRCVSGPRGDHCLLRTDWYIRQLIRRPVHGYDAAKGPGIYIELSGLHASCGPQQNSDLLLLAKSAFQNRRK